MARRSIFEGNGVEILRDTDGRLFIAYEYGQAVSWMMVAEITNDEAEQAQRSTRDADSVLRAVEKRGTSRPVQEMIFDKFGVMLFHDTNTDRYGIRYDEGGIAGDVSAAEAERLQRSEREALEVVAACDRRAQ